MKPFQRFAVLGTLTVLSLGLLNDYANALGSNGLAGRRVIAFLHATVIPMDRERVLRDHTVVVSDGTTPPEARAKLRQD